MRGTINGREVVLHLATIVRRWGTRAYTRCLRALVVNEQTAFLEAVHAPALAPVPAVSRRFPAPGARRPPRWR